MLGKHSKKFAALTAAVQVLSVVAVFTPSSAEAGQIINRSVSLSSSAPSASNVTYSFKLNLASTTSVGALMVRFCSDSPIKSDTCTASDIVTTGVATLSTSGGIGTGFTLDGTYNAANDDTILATRVAAATSTADSTISFNGITNPTTANQTYYVRFWTCATNAACTEAASEDFGGFATSTSASITVSAKVMETLNFCSYTGINCGAAGDTVDLGVLSTSKTTAGKSRLDVGTNALRGVTVVYHGDTLKSGTNDINAKGATAGTLPAGTENFGINVASNTGTTWKIANAGTAYTSTGRTGTGTLANVNATYNSDEQVAFVADTDGANVNNTSLATPTDANTIIGYNAPVDKGTYEVSYAAAIGNTTAPGLYSTTINYVATGLF